MNDGFQFIDIVFFAMIAAFLVLRLRSVLGRRTGNERPHDGFNPRRSSAEPRNDNVVELPDRRRQAEVPEQYQGTPVGAGLTQIKVADPAFSPDGFLSGAREAFAMIVGAFAAGDAASLRPLLSDEVFSNFSAAIDQRAAAGETLETELVGIKKAEIAEARMDGFDAVVTIRFVSDQVNVLRDKAGEVVDGDPTRVTEVTDLWTFARDTRSPDPNWSLVATRSNEE